MSGFLRTTGIQTDKTGDKWAQAKANKHKQTPTGQQAQAKTNNHYQTLGRQQNDKDETHEKASQIMKQVFLKN